MARDRGQSEDFVQPIRRVLVVLFALFLIAIFLIWRIDSPRVERLRAQVVDRVVPSFDWALVPLAGLANMAEGFQSYARIYEQNQELRRELQQMKAWKAAALQLEQQNAKLLDLNNVRLDPKLTFVTGVVVADSGSPFRQSVLLNIGARDGLIDGWAATDGLGLAGRVSGVGQNSARVILLTDVNSRVPVELQPSGQVAVMNGDNTRAPVLDFIDAPDQVRPGDRVVSSGSGGVFPPGLLVGQVAMGTDGRMRVRLSADYERLEFLRILRAHPQELVTDPGQLLAPDEPPNLDSPTNEETDQSVEANDG